MFNIELMLIVALGVGYLVYREIQKVTKIADEAEQNPDMSGYTKFCDDIDEEIDRVSRELKLDIIKLTDESKKDEFLEKLSMLSKELVFVQNMSSSNKNRSDWESRLFGLLSKFEEILNKYIVDSELKNDEIRESLRGKFQG
ncbi:MAG: hypothetical protein GX282_07680 [Campylobacteraceae bacterium]|nr:hypothetical protein [Campylobacteraceae bacterium]